MRPGWVGHDEADVGRGGLGTPNLIRPGEARARDLRMGPRKRWAFARWLSFRSKVAWVRTRVALEIRLAVCTPGFRLCQSSDASPGRDTAGGRYDAARTSKLLGRCGTERLLARRVAALISKTLSSSRASAHRAIPPSVLLSLPPTHPTLTRSCTHLRRASSPRSRPLERLSTPSDFCSSSPPPNRPFPRPSHRPSGPSHLPLSSRLPQTLDHLFSGATRPTC